MAKVIAKGKSELLKEYGDVRITIDGDEDVSDISVEGKDIDEVDSDVISAKVEYYIENPRYVFPSYIPEPDTMLSAYAAMVYLFQEHGNGEIETEGDIGTIPTPYGEDAVY